MDLAKVSRDVVRIMKQITSLQRQRKMNSARQQGLKSKPVCRGFELVKYIKAGILKCAETQRTIGEPNDIRGTTENSVDQSRVCPEFLSEVVANIYPCCKQREDSFLFSGLTHAGRSWAKERDSECNALSERYKTHTERIPCYRPQEC